MYKLVEVVGVYVVDSNADVHMIELLIKSNPKDIGIDQITQEEKGKERINWQAAYDEHYLDNDGIVVIGDSSKVIETQSNITRITFFMYYIDFSMPLLSKYGEIKLPEPQPMPERLKNIIEFEDAD